MIRRTSPSKNLAALLLCGTLLLGCDRAPSPEDIQARVLDHAQRAENYRSSGQYRAAIIEARNALQLNAQDRTALAELATILNDVGQGKAAAKALEPIAATANRSEAVLIAQAYFLQNKHQSALDYLAQHDDRLQLANDATANLIRARAALRLNQLDIAAATLAKLDEKDVPATIERARLAQLRGDIDESNRLIEALLHAHPNNVEVLSEAALRAEQRGQLEQASDLLSGALLNLPDTDILLPGKTAVLQRLVSTLTKLGRSTEALTYAKTIADANPQGTLLHDKFKQGLELFQAGKLDEAEPLLLEVYTESSNDTIGTLLGLIRYARGDIAGANNYLSTSVDPEVAPEAAVTALAATQLQMAQPEKLLALFNANSRKQISNPALQALLGVALLQTGATAEGEQLVTRALANKPENAAINATVARYYLASQQPAKAIAVLEATTGRDTDRGLTKLIIAAYAQAGRPDDALAAAKRQAELQPHTAENWGIYGRAALLLKRNDVAESALHKALSLQSDYLPARVDQAHLLLSRKQLDAAEAEFIAALKQQPENARALKGLVVTLAQKKTDAAALETKVLAASSTNTARATLAEYQLLLGQPDDAMRLLGSASSDYARTTRIRVVLAQTLTSLRARDIAAARRHVADGFTTDPNSPDLQLMLARIEIADGKPDQAQRIAAQFDARYARLPALIELNGDLAALAKQPAKAATLYRSAWEQSSGDAVAIKLFHSLQTVSEQTAFLKEWSERAPQSDAPYVLRGISEQQAGNRAAAIAAYEAALQRNASNATTLNNLASLYQEAGDHRGLATAERAYALQPENAAILDTYGWILVNSGQREKGIAQLERAATLKPEVKEIQDHLREARK